MLIRAICGRLLRTQYPCKSAISVGEHHLLLEVYSPTDSTDFHRFYISRFPCSSALSVGDSSAPNIRVNLRYLWENIICCLRLFSRRFHGFSQILYIPISVLICAICWRLLRTQYPCKSAISVGEDHLLLEVYSPTDSTDFHRFYISRFPCKSVLSVGDSSARCLRDVVPQIPRIFTDFSYSRCICEIL